MLRIPQPVEALHDHSKAITRRVVKASALDTLLETKVLTERWRREHNQIRPHRLLGYKPLAPRLSGFSNGGKEFDKAPGGVCASVGDRAGQALEPGSGELSAAIRGDCLGHGGLAKERIITDIMRPSGCK